MTKKQLVSILIPVFNAEKWIGCCIESALAQTWPLKEIIVVDDGSTDSTFQVAKTYAASNILVKKQDNCGASAARNHALSLAQGDYIQWLDADDLLAPDKIERQMEVAAPGRTSRVLLSSKWGRFYTNPSETQFHYDGLWEDLTPLEWLFRKVNDNLWMAIETWLVSRRLTDIAGPWDETLHRDNDGEYFCRVLCSSVGIHFVEDACSYVRRGNVGVSHNRAMNDRKLDSLMASHFSYINSLRVMEDSERTRRACLKLLETWSIYFYPERPDLFEKAQVLAANLGGCLARPRLPLKYRWLQYLIGLRTAKKVRLLLADFAKYFRWNQE